MAQDRYLQRVKEQIEGAGYPRDGSVDIRAVGACSAVAAAAVYKCWVLSVHVFITGIICSFSSPPIDLLLKLHFCRYHHLIRR